MSRWWRGRTSSSRPCRRGRSPPPPAAPAGGRRPSICSPISTPDSLPSPACVCPPKVCAWSPPPFERPWRGRSCAACRWCTAPASKTIRRCWRASRRIAL
ncbi:protein of unknown function (plasmid) [Azospirillum baldaniorum]|uniref:Uncharacterized protein n=1 Tax=Azospirillum baldaniorum TaxID=1064539 RepID=A0A9P1JXX8_9PROT|nr:protein of unknown function [Azospirillum baldaniorum]